MEWCRNFLSLCLCNCCGKSADRDRVDHEKVTKNADVFRNNIEIEKQFECIYTRIDNVNRRLIAIEEESETGIRPFSLPREDYYRRPSRNSADASSSTSHINRQRARTETGEGREVISKRPGKFFVFSNKEISSKIKAHIKIMKRSLKKVGFTVLEFQDCSTREMLESMWTETSNDVELHGYAIINSESPLEYERIANLIAEYGSEEDGQFFLMLPNRKMDKKEFGFDGVIRLRQRSTSECTSSTEHSGPSEDHPNQAMIEMTSFEEISNGVRIQTEEKRFSYNLENAETKL